MSRSIAFHTLGCKLNYSETSTIARSVVQEGYLPVPFDGLADIYVINTCSVTENADKECREIVRRALRKNAEALVIIIGCYAQLKPKDISEIPGVDLVLGASEKFELIKHLNSLHHKQMGTFYNCDIDTIEEFNASYSIADRTRTFLKVQDGCDFGCTYCTIPMARGKSRSNSIENIIQDAHIIGMNGVQEIVLTGVNTGDYGLYINANPNRTHTFYQLIQALETNINVPRFRISSIEPNLLTHKIIDFVAHSHKFMPHFHIPLQSGSNRILRLMKRRYTTEHYAELVYYIKDKLPHAAIGVDVITGFPGETDIDFRLTFDFIHSLPISYLHVFTYSERPNTLAADMKDVIPMAIRKERNQQLRNLSEKKKRYFYKQFINSSRPVLFESENVSKQMLGYTDNYLRVSIPYDAKMINTICQINLEEINSETIFAGSFNINKNNSLLPNDNYNHVSYHY